MIKFTSKRSLLFPYLFRFLSSGKKLENLKFRNRTMSGKNNFQPPTKTYEYIMSGLFCIATNTTANKEIIDNSNGILTRDNSKSLADAIIKTYKKRFNLNSFLIQDTLKNHTWNQIIDNKLTPLIES